MEGRRTSFVAETMEERTDICNRDVLHLKEIEILMNLTISTKPDNANAVGTVSRYSGDSRIVQ